MSLPDYNDMMAAENRRQEVAARAGVSIRVLKGEPSIFKDLQIKFQENLYPMEVVREFSELMAETKFPGYNWGTSSQDVADVLDPKGRLASERQQTRTPEEEAAEMERLQAESIENELKVTRTSTGQPKVDDSGNVVTPIQETTPEADATAKRDQKQRDLNKDREEKIGQAKPVQPAAVVVKDSDKK